MGMRAIDRSRADLLDALEKAEARADGMERAGAEQARRADQNQVDLMGWRARAAAAEARVKDLEAGIPRLEEDRDALQRRVMEMENADRGEPCMACAREAHNYCMERNAAMARVEALKVDHDIHVAAVHAAQGRITQLEEDLAAALKSSSKWEALSTAGGVDINTLKREAEDLRARIKQLEERLSEAQDEAAGYCSRAYDRISQLETDLVKANSVIKQTPSAAHIAKLEADKLALEEQIASLQKLASEQKTETPVGFERGNCGT